MMPPKGKGRGSRIQQGAPQTEMQIKSWAIHWGTPEQSRPWEEFPWAEMSRPLTLRSVFVSKTESDPEGANSWELSADCAPHS